MRLTNYYCNEFACSKYVNILLDKGKIFGLVFNETSVSRKFMASGSLIRDILILLEHSCS